MVEKFIKPLRKADDEWEYVKIRDGKKIIMKKYHGKLVKIGEEPAPRNIW